MNFSPFCQVAFILNAWRATRTDQQHLGESLIEMLKKNQVEGDCNRLIAGLQNLPCMKEKSLGKLCIAIGNLSKYVLNMYDLI